MVNRIWDGFAEVGIDSRDDMTKVLIAGAGDAGFCLAGNYLSLRPVIGW